MKANTTTPVEDLQAIREIMERSSKFLSLSGLSGIFAGVCALAGAAVAWFFLPVRGFVTPGDPMAGGSIPAPGNLMPWLALDALLVLTLAIAGAVIFSLRKARRSGLPVWTPSTRRVILHLLIPLATGGLFVLILVMRGHPELVAPVMLVFYGLSLVNAGKFTLGEIHYLGLSEIALGLLAGMFPAFGFLLWTLGFGAVHIVYGAVMYYRYER